MSKVNILLAEDNRGDVLLVRKSLRQHKVEHDLHVVRDGQEALDYLLRIGEPGSPCPDLLLLDLNLPKADGAMVLSEFRQHQQCGRVPVIIVTSSDSPKDRDRVAKLGISHYFRKPSEYEEYLELGNIVRAVILRSDAEP